MSAPPRLRDPLLFGAVLVFFVAFWGLQLARWPQLSTDELFSPTAAVLLEAGLPMRSDSLRLVPFCGGCAINTVAATGLFSVLPAQLWAWRLVPFATGLLTLLLVWRIGGSLGGRRGAATVAWLFALAPPAWRAMGVQGFGNHIEVMAIVFAAFVAFESLVRRDRPRDAFVLGALTGFATFYAYIAAFLGPALGLAWLRSRPERLRLPAFLAGGVVGFAPWALLRLLPPGGDATRIYGRSLSDVLGAEVGVSERLGALVGPGFWSNLFAPELWELPWLGLLWLLAATVGLAALVRARATPMGAAVLASLIVFTLEWLVLAPGLPRWPPMPGVGGPHIHYLMPAVALLMLSFGALWRDGPLRRLAAPVVGLALGLGAFGLAVDLADPWDRSSLLQPAVDLAPGAISISAPLPEAPEGYPGVDVDDVLGIRPGRREARRLLLAQLGRTLPPVLGHWSPAQREDFRVFVSGLDPADRRWLAHGLVQDVLPQTDLPPEPLAADLAAALGPWPDELRFELQRAIRRLTALGRGEQSADGAPGRLRALAQAAAESTDLVMAQVLAWEIGFVAVAAVEKGDDPPESPGEQATEALALMPPLPPALLLHAQAGIAEGLTEDWAWRADGEAAVRAALPAVPEAISEAVCAHHLRCD